MQKLNHNDTTTRLFTVPYVMRQRFFWPFRALLKWLFGSIQYPDVSAKHLQALSQEGVVVYITRGHSLWLTLCFNYVLKNMQLPLASFVGGVRFFWMQRPSRLWRYFCERHMPVVLPFATHHNKLNRLEALLACTVFHHQTAFLALAMPRSTRANPPDLNNYIYALLITQKHMTRPIYLSPHILVDRAQSGAANQTLVDRLFGDKRRPGGLRHLAMLLTLRHGILRMADPINLQTYIQNNPDIDDIRLARKLRHELQWRMSEEERVVAGPHLPVYDITARHVLRDPIVRGAIAEQTTTGTSDLALEMTAQEYLRGIAARYNVRSIQLMSYILNLVFNRIYDGIVVDKKGLHTVIEASRRGPLIFCPSHRSHIDYLVLSFVLWHHGIAPPHIAAGANLSFFPLGMLFRTCGAFFLRRSFRNDPLYSAVLHAYMVELIKEGTSIEFFIEGTRSRTGKLLQPKFGMLTMIVDAWRRGARDDVQFVPVSIDYERIIEAPTYKRELQGADKRAEDLTGLINSTKVLRSRYGQLQVQFGEPISLARVAQEAHLPQSTDVAWQPAYRKEIERLGFRIMHSVAMACSVTPTAVVSTALLGHPGRGMAQGILLQRCNSIVEFLEGAAARLSLPLQHSTTRISAVLEAVQKLVDDGSVVVDRAGSSDMEPIYRVPEQMRVILDFHKNALMNYFAPAAIIARAIKKRMPSTLCCNDLHTDVLFLSKLFKKEFIYRTDSDIYTYFDENLGALAIRGFLDVLEDDTIIVHQSATILHLAGLLDSFVQAYAITAKTLLDLQAFSLGYKEVVARILERTRRAFLEGHITRPEAANRSLIESALSWMIKADIVAIKHDGKKKSLRLKEHVGLTNVQQLIEDLQPYL